MRSSGLGSGFAHLLYLVLPLKRQGKQNFLFQRFTLLCFFDSYLPVQFLFVVLSLTK